MQKFQHRQNGKKTGIGGICTRHGMPFRGGGKPSEEEDKKIRNDIQERVSVL